MSARHEVLSLSTSILTETTLDVEKNFRSSSRVRYSYRQKFYISRSTNPVFLSGANFFFSVGDGAQNFIICGKTLDRLEFFNCEVIISYCQLSSLRNKYQI
jgi:hypothetical protein